MEPRLTKDPQSPDQELKVYLKCPHQLIQYILSTVPWYHWIVLKDQREILMQVLNPMKSCVAD